MGEQDQPDTQQDTTYVRPAKRRKTGEARAAVGSSHEQNDTHRETQSLSQRSAAPHKLNISRDDHKAYRQRASNSAGYKSVPASRGYGTRDSGDHHANRERTDRPRTRKTKRERKENPSSRIHSLRKQLSRGGLPPTIHREKERELASLVFEQQKQKGAAEAKANLEKYHFIRFMERQKAQRKIKSLRKEAVTIERRPGDDAKRQRSERIAHELEEAEVDLNYALYCPLGEKYISLYGKQDRAGSGFQKGGTDHQIGSGQRDETSTTVSDDVAAPNKIQKADHKAANEVNAISETSRANVSHSHEEHLQKTKPAIWHEVRAAMRKGQSKLEALRDRKAGGFGPNSIGTLAVTTHTDTKPERDDIGTDLLDADTESMSDGDGGFFEKC